ncbi:monooxygenase [Aspergillus ibericus CBS 121593]|uniref:Monooxygenase n=1 Tax=Aspergillus ibericus CBS 121593 TaxID=1448316 RepID=A0A395GMX1_9EURO|nr:monooxygenase [Aspergillus ibericus CBS 121593]RAK95363.1 monooxygenase [Aspergillus ibericus CBS 121593]
MATTSTEQPPRADLREMMNRHPLPTLTPGLIDPSSMAGDEASTQARATLTRLNTALATDDGETLQACLYADQAYWKDQLALTWHLRTFSGPETVATSLLETTKLRKLAGEIEIDGAATFLPATPVLQFIDCPLIFRTESPAGLCRGKMLLLPVVREDQGVSWKIWILSTRLESLDMQSEDEGLLRSAGRQLDNSTDFDTDVFIIGAGNAAVALSARLKALGVETVMADRNARPGDNWALRYDCMRFHIPTAFCELPYMCYDKELQSPHLLTRQDLASQVRRYVESFNLNVIHSARIQWTEYDEVAKKWSITFQTPAGQRRATSKHLVMATGIGSQKPRIPQIADPHLYKGISIHSVEYKNAKLLREQGAKTVMIIGSANTAFDVLEDCHHAGLEATIVARSPTYVVPLEYVCHPNSLGAYNAGVDAADKLFLSLPAVVDGQLSRGLFAMFASNEPERYAALEAAGFPTLDSRDPTCALMQNLLERAGGHYIDVGGTKLIAEKNVQVKAGVEPVAYTETGLRFSDGSCVDADAVVWCTGFSDSNVVDTATEILGGQSDAKRSVAEAEANDQRAHIWRPRDIASRLDATWGLDEEGEIRGMWKRHVRVENIWVMGGYTQQHRWHSRTLALQIKAALEGILPPAYRHTPIPRVGDILQGGDTHHARSPSAAIGERSVL